ncbi:MAG: SIS domain-containing protein [Anaerolineales bacterium]|jgi:D-sedoheptulose 7-phosphate isomerase
MTSFNQQISQRINAISEALKEPTVASQTKNLISSIQQCYQSNKKVIAFGNGGNAANAEQLVTELIARYCFDRDAIGAVLITAAGPFTAINNDYGYGQGFARQVSGLAENGDIVVGFSSSGTSENVIEAIEAAKKKKATTVGFSAMQGKLREIVDIPIIVNSTFTPVIEEAHLILIHIICGEVEEALFSGSGVRIRTPDYL